MAKSLTEKEKLKLCRLYKGEEDCPFGYDTNEGYYWDMECFWVLHDDNERPRARKTQEYEDLGGKRFSDIPYSLVIAMYQKWSHWSDYCTTPAEYLKPFYENCIGGYKKLIAE